MRRKFLKTAFFHFWSKVMLLLNPFSTGILWNIPFKKKAKNGTLNGCISKARANSESKLTFWESSFNFIQTGLFLARSTTWVHGMGLLLLQSPVLLPGALLAKRVNDEPVKDFNLFLFVNFIWKWEETFEKVHFITFSPKQCFYLNHSAREYLKNSH